MSIFSLFSQCLTFFNKQPSFYAVYGHFLTIVTNDLMSFFCSKVLISLQILST